jgi:hypothetical protein
MYIPLEKLISPPKAVSLAVAVGVIKTITMKKKYLIIGSLAFTHLFAKAQTQDSIPKVNKTQIDVVYNHYIQQGNNSAVTGGVGTEELTVYGPSTTIKRQWTKNSFKANFGADIISSASTDNIDFVMSSVSVLDARSYINAVYEHSFPNKDLTIYGGGGFSIESDYFSLGSKLGFIKENSKKLEQYSAEFQVFNDDLRWGRLNNGQPQKLIYPYELRYKEWYDIYLRNSYNLKLGYSKALNKRTIVGIYPLIAYQEGLLATPFHRIYFNDGSQAVEQLPNQRLRASVALKWNQFVGNRYIIKMTLNPYIDNWGVKAITLENETAIKLNAIWTVLPNVRFYMQKGSQYFAPYREHRLYELFYSSDYDLATIQTYNIGFGARYTPYRSIGKKSQFNNLLFRYNYLYRSNGLFAHILSLSYQLEWDKLKK